MRCWAGWLVVAGVAVLTACSGSAGGGAAGPSGGRSSGPSRGEPASTSASPSWNPSTSASANPTTGTPSAPATGASAPAGSCASRHAQVTVVPGGAVEQRLCVRPGTVVTLTLRPRADDRRWTAVHSSAPVFVLASGWRVDADGTAHATLRCAAVRAGAAEVTVLAKAPDVAGASRTAFTVNVSVVPQTKEG
jgi:hypothetical protein